MIPGLSRQESRVLALAAEGRIDKQIAAELGISLGTVRVYWKRIRAKHGGTRSEVLVAYGRGGIEAAPVDPAFEFVATVDEALCRDAEGRESTTFSVEIPSVSFADGERVRVTLVRLGETPVDPAVGTGGWPLTVSSPEPAWRPIDTAPRDGSLVLVSFWGYGREGGERTCSEGRWVARLGEWADDDDTALYPPTHWAPIPPLSSIDDPAAAPAPTPARAEEIL